VPSNEKLLHSCRIFSDPINPTVNGRQKWQSMVVSALLRRLLGFPASTTCLYESAESRKGASLVGFQKCPWPGFEGEKWNYTASELPFSPGFGDDRFFSRKLD
jgi:hypothetical protein